MLAALLIVSLVFGLLLESVTTNLSNLGRARREARAMQLAEDRARALEVEIANGALIEVGVTEGEYEEPDEDLRWQIAVSAQTLDLPADYPGAEPPSPLFAVAGRTALPAPFGPDAPQPPLLLVEVRVHGIDVDPNEVEPYVLLLTSPPDPARIAERQQQRQQEIPQAPDGSTGTAPR